MAASATYTVTVNRTASFTETTSTGTNTETINPYALTDKAVSQVGSDTYSIAASGSADIWPDAVGTIAAGDTVHFDIWFYFGSTDTTKANKEMTITKNAEVYEAYGHHIAIEVDAVTTVVIARLAGNEAMIAKVFWYVYTV